MCDDFDSNDDTAEDAGTPSDESDIFHEDAENGIDAILWAGHWENQPKQRASTGNSGCLVIILGIGATGWMTWGLFSRFI